MRSCYLVGAALSALAAGSAAQAQDAVVQQTSPSQTTSAPSEPASQHAAPVAQPPGTAPANEDATPSQAASAQNAANGQPAGASVLLDEIVVTARKRGVAEKAQDTPIALTVFNEAQYKAVFAQDLRDLGRLAPNVKFEGSTIVGLQNFTIRGMGITGSTPSDSPAVGIFQNGVFWGSNYGALLETFDIESVEILRGPQGTLFGRNVTGGAVVVRTKRPGQEFGLDADATIGTYGQKDLSLAVEGPIAGPTLRARVVGLYRSTDGYYHNLETGKRYGAADTRLLRGTLVFQPTGNLDVTLIGDYYKSTGDSTPVVGIEVPGTLPYKAGFRQPANYWDIRLDRPGRSDIEVHSATLEANLNAAHGVITSVSGYRYVFNKNNTDFDGTNFSGFNQSILFHSKQYSSELRYASKFNGPLNFTVGGYLFDLDHQFREGRNLNANSTIFASGNHLHESSEALFGEFDLKFGTVTFTGGARYTAEKIKAESRPFGACPLPATTDINRYLDLTLPCDLGPSGQATYHDVSPKIGVNWKPDANNMVYANATRGFRSGGFSLRGSAITPPFNPEKVTAYEVGYKGDLLEKRLRLNVAVYLNKYDNLQRTIVFVSPTLGTFQKTGNAASATIKGAEFDITLQAAKNLVLTANYGYTDAKFNSFVGLDVTGDGVPDPDLAKQLKFVRVPKSTASASANYTVPFNSGAHLDFRVAATYQSGQFLDDLNKFHEGAYTLLDGSVSYTTADKKWRASLFVKNLTEKKYYYYSASLGALGLIQLPGAPRQIGAQLSFHY
ncbi:MAG TPA: TonB-dependent receptor [Allosphingosinicella sp.]|jgi:outer membrane receptor protein involved in Fe transport